jgi:hypothetical protein
MTRQDDIENLLRQIAPLFLDVAQEAQVVAADLGDTDWARANLTRTASLNQVAGTARWRMVGDGLVAREAEMPVGLGLSTTDEEQNQGRYYLIAPDLAIVLTIRRKPHPEDEQPHALQLQIAGVLEQAPIAYDDEIVVYFAVPPLGREPTFEVATRGKEVISYRLIDLIDDRFDQPDGGLSPNVSPLPPTAPAGPIVRSSLDKDEDKGEEGPTDPRG